MAAGAWAAGLLAGVVDLPPLTVTLAAPSHFRPWRASPGPTAAWPSVVHYAPDGAPLGFGAYAVWAPGVGMKVGLEDRASGWTRTTGRTRRRPTGWRRWPPT